MHEISANNYFPYASGTIIKEMRSLFNIPEDAEIRLWNKYSTDTCEQLTNIETTAQDAGIYNGQLLELEVRGCDGTWPHGVKG